MIILRCYVQEQKDPASLAGLCLLQLLLIRLLREFLSQFVPTHRLVPEGHWSQMSVGEKQVGRSERKLAGLTSVEQEV